MYSLILKTVNPNSMFLFPVTAIEIENIIKSLKNNAAGHDDISACILKDTFNFLIEPLKHILNLSFEQGVFPKELKVAKVVPIFKSGDPKLIQNYRPVSVLPVFFQDI